MWPLSFISEDDFFNHVKTTIHQYGDKLESFDLAKFNKNMIDPIKLIFDKLVYFYSWDEIINNEILRQRDKSNNNDIGYFHQRIFQYINGCEVPASGWDIIFSTKNGINIYKDEIVSRVFVEIKNKHNTMNSASSRNTYTKMQSQILDDDDCACFLVEVIAKQSQNIKWICSIDGHSKKHSRIRRVSIDKFYSLVTGQVDAFYQMCMVLPDTIRKAVAEIYVNTFIKDSVVNELEAMAQSKGISKELCLYLLGFRGYDGF